MKLVKQFIEKHWPRIVANFKIERDVEIRLRPLPRRRTLGNHTTVGAATDQGTHKICLDISKSLRTLIETLFHELTHAEQVEDGRLKHQYNGVRRRWEWIWHERNFGRNKGFGQTSRQLQAYSNQPWEVEANSRAQFEMDLFEKEVGTLNTQVALGR